ncbi:MAG TPA: hypothetical protein PLW77_06380 [Bacteroidales bacterium]|nr:hypothetical protein [Bacteroidales bacterium]HQB21909.1 hypothetical protein [Bacteroidales bacterium]
MLKDKNNLFNKLIWFLFAITIVITLAPFFKVGITTADDLENYMHYLYGTVFSDSWKHAIQSGRFYFIITKPLQLLPYLGDNFIFTKTIQHLALLLSYIMAAILIKKVFKSREIALLLFLVLLMATPVSTNYHTAFIAYPFYFTFSFALFISAVLLFIKYTETNKYKFLIFSAIIFFISLLFYETYLLFLLFFCIWLFVRNIKQAGGFKNFFKSRTSYKELVPFVSSGLLYVILYFSFRIIFKSENNIYIGSSFAQNFSWSNFMSVLYKLTKTVFPLQIFNLDQDYINQLELSYNSSATSFVSILKNTDLSTIVNIAVQLAIFIYLFIRLKNISGYKKLGLGILFSLLFAFSAHSVLAVAEKYNNATIATTIKGYVTSYYSYFGIWLAILLFVIIIYKLVKKNKYLKYTAIVLFSVAFAYISIVNSYSNRILARGWGQSQIRFLAIDEMIEKGAFNDCPAGALIYSPDIYWTNVFGYVPDTPDAQGFNWGKYINIKSDPKINVILSSDRMLEAHNEFPDAKIFRLVKNYTSIDNDMLFVLAEVDKNSINWDKGKDMFVDATCTRAKVYYYSKSNDFVVQFKTVENANDGFALINGVDLSPISNGINQINVRDITDTGILANFDIEFDVPVYTESFSASNMIPKYSTAIDLIDQTNIKFSKINKIDTEVDVSAENEFPLALIEPISIDKTYDVISLNAQMEINIANQENGFALVIEIRDDKNEIILWEGYDIKNESEVNFSKLINLVEMRDKNPKLLQLYIWNPNKCEFKINKVKNVTIKAL